MVFLRKQITDRAGNVEFRQGIAVSRVSNKSPRVATSSFAGEIQAVFYGFDMARMLKGLLAELLFGSVGAEIPTYVRNDNSTAVYQVDSADTVTNAKRLNGFLQINRGGLERNKWLSVGYIPGGLNTSDGITKSMSSANSRRLLNGNSSRIGTEIQEAEIRTKITRIETLYCLS